MLTITYQPTNVAQHTYLSLHRGNKIVSVFREGYMLDCVVSEPASLAHNLTIKLFVFTLCLLQILIWREPQRCQWGVFGHLWTYWKVMWRWMKRLAGKRMKPGFYTIPLTGGKTRWSKVMARQRQRYNTGQFALNMPAINVQNFRDTGGNWGELLCLLVLRWGSVTCTSDGILWAQPEYLTWMYNEKQFSVASSKLLLWATPCNVTLCGHAIVTSLLQILQRSEATFSRPYAEIWRRCAV